jgi:hypothetical protein
MCADARCVPDQVVLLDHLQRRQRRRRGHRVFLVRVVAIRVGACDVEALMRHAGGNRQHATAKRLAQHHDVRRGAVVLGRKEAAGLAQAGGNFVKDQQRAVRVAGLAHGLPVARRRHEGHCACGLGDDGCHIALALQHVLHHAGAGEAATLQVRVPLRVHLVTIGAAVTAERRHMLAARQQGPDAAAAEQGLAAHAARAKSGTVERVPEAQGLEAAGGGARDLDRHFNSVRPSSGEQHTPRRAGEPLELCRQGLRQFDRAVTGKTAWRKTQRVELCLDRRQNPRVRVADVVHVVAMEIHVAPAGHVLDPDALGAPDGVQAGRRDGLVQEGSAVARQQLARVRVEVLALPLHAPGAMVDVAFALARVDAAGGVHGCQMISK